jgi:23S rRNA (adenine2030-N6)-methyltransferase
MNYRHIYHAGGIADVFKHVVLIALLDRLKQKNSAFFALDSHAGVGIYDLGSAAALKTGEFRSGIERLSTAALASPLLIAYRDAVKAINDPGSFRYYPGSPVLIAQALRPQDRGIACELHKDDFPELRRAIKAFSTMAAHHRSGYEAMGAFLPPAEKRGLVLIDPPYENPDELSATAAAIRKAHTRFGNGVYALWYPIKERPAVWRFHEDMIASGIKDQITIEFLTHDEGDSRRLNGSGLLIINPPYRFETDLKTALEELRVIMAPAGKVIIKQLAPE